MIRVNKFRFSTVIPWKHEVTIFGNKMMMENRISRKVFAVKVLDSFRRYRLLRSDLKTKGFYTIFSLLTGWEVYNYLNGGNSNTIGSAVANLMIYGSFGKVLRLNSPGLFYICLGSGVVFTLINNFVIKDNLSERINKELNIDNFSFINTTNIIPKLIISTSLIKFLDFFLTEKKYMINGKVPFLNRKAFLMFICLFGISKLTNFISYLTSNTIRYEYI